MAMMRLLDDAVQLRRTCIALVIYLGVVSVSEASARKQLCAGQCWAAHRGHRCGLPADRHPRGRRDSERKVAAVAGVLLRSLLRLPAHSSGLATWSSAASSLFMNSPFCRHRHARLGLGQRALSLLLSPVSARPAGDPPTAGHNASISCDKAFALHRCQKSAASVRFLGKLGT